MKKERRLHEQQFLRNNILKKLSEEITILLHKKTNVQLNLNVYIDCCKFNNKSDNLHFATVKTKGDHTMPKGASLNIKDLKKKTQMKEEMQNPKKNW